MTAKREKCLITVSHRIHFANPDNLDAYHFAMVVNGAKAKIKEIWEDPEFKWRCCKVKFKFEYPKAAGEDADSKNVHPKDGRSKQDKLGPGQSTGEWYVGDDFVNPKLIPHPDPDVHAAAHEVGHELGATDKYEPKDSKGDTISDQVYQDGKLVDNPKFDHYDPKGNYPRDGLMFHSKTGKVQQADIDEIMASLGVDCPDDCCK